MSSLRKAMRMPLGLPATRWMLKFGAVLIGTDAELVLKSRRVVPTKLTQKGFTFTYPEINSALKNLLSA